MIAPPLPPEDPALPAMRISLDPAEAGASLSEHVATRSGGTLALAACRAMYVKYKPSHHCTIQYELTLRPAGQGPSMSCLAHLTLHRPGRAERASSGRMSDQAAVRAAALHPGLPLEISGYVPRLEGALFLYPIDPRLPGLVQAASAEAAGPLLRHTLASRLGPDVGVEEVQLVRYKPEKRAALRYRLRDSQVLEVFTKLRSDDRGAALVAVARDLAASGVPTPAPVGYLPELRALVSERGEGNRLKDLRGRTEYLGWMAPVSQVLARIHATEPSSRSVHAAEDEAAELINAGEVIGTLLPKLASPAGRIARLLASELEAVAPSVTTVHGSFHDDQVLVSGGGVVVIDLDSVHVGDPMTDVGHFLAYLSADEGEAARSGFVEAYTRVRGDPGRRYLLWEAAHLFRWATLPFRELRQDWPEAVERRVRLAELRFDDYRSGRPEARYG